MEVEAEVSDEDMAEDRRGIPEIEFIRLDQALECRKMVLSLGPGPIPFVDLLWLCRDRGEELDPASTFQPLVQRFPVDRSSPQQAVERRLLFDCEIGTLVEVEYQTIDFVFPGMNGLLVVEEVISERDPRRIPGAVAALRRAMLTCGNQAPSAL